MLLRQRFQGGVTLKDVPNCKHRCFLARRRQASGVLSLSRRGFLKLVGMSSAGATLAACTPSQPKSIPKSGEKMQLVYQDWLTD